MEKLIKVVCQVTTNLYFLLPILLNFEWKPTFISSKLTRLKYYHEVLWTHGYGVNFLIS